MGICGLVQWRARGSGLKGSVGDILLSSPWQSGEIEVQERGVFNAEFTEDAEGRRRRERSEMSIGKHGRG